LVIGCILPVIKSKRKYYQVQYPDKRLAWVKKNEVLDITEVFDKPITKDELVATAKKFLGIPYLWGGTSSKAIDCSGFTSTVYYMNGTLLQRDASQQTKYGKEITTDYKWKQLQPGDLLFFGRKATDSLPERVTHVALYIGDSEFIHASGKVRINSMDSSRDNFISSYVPRFVRAVRIEGETGGAGIEQLSENDFYKEIISNKK
jgi:cell wall-associated NlpC family hydrolase